MKPIVTRAEWGAEHGTGSPDPGPESQVVIHNSYRPALKEGATAAAEIEAVWGIERYHTQNNGWAGIGYNFLVAPSGRVYEGRGWKYRGAHAGPANADSIGICLMIDGQKQVPSSAMVLAVRKLIRMGVELGEITEDFTISGHRDHMARTCPGDLVYSMLSAFKPRPEPEYPVPKVDLVGDEPQLLGREFPASLEPLLQLSAYKVFVQHARTGETFQSFFCRTLEKVLDSLPFWVTMFIRRTLEEKLGCSTRTTED